MQLGRLDVPVAGKGAAGVIAQLARKTARLVIPERLRIPARVAATRTLALRERRKAARLLHHRPLLLHVGCGFTRKEGWVNIDLIGGAADIYWDLLVPLPFPDGSADGVFHEHVLEHFELEAGTRLLSNCFRVLKPGGILRVAVPDVWRYAVSYVNDPERRFIQTMRPGYPTALLGFQQIFFNFGHQTMYDFETLSYVLGRVGFASIRECQYNDTELPRQADSEHRRMESLYVECSRPL